MTASQAGRGQPRFEIQVGEGRGSLLLRPQTFFGWLRVEHLELEIPPISFPLDITAGMNQFKRQSCRVLGATLSVDRQALEQLAQVRSAELHAAGFDDVSLRLGESAIAIEGRARIADRQADFAARAQLEVTADGLVRIAVVKLRTFGYLRRPALQLAHDLLCVLLGAGPSVSDTRQDSPAATAAHLGEVLARPLEWFLAAALPSAGWRVPHPGALARPVLRLSAARGELRYAGAEHGSDVPAADRPVPKSALRVADEKLLHNDLGGAAAAYRALLARRPEDEPALTERLLAVLCSRDATIGEAERVARDGIGRLPDFVPGHLALAAASLARGDEAAAASELEHALSASEAAGEDDDAVRAGLAAARLLQAVDPDGAARIYQRVLARRPGHLEAIDALTARYLGEGRWTELVGLYQQRLSLALDGASRSREHRRIAELYLDKLHDPGSARAELKRAVEVDDTHIEAWDALARALALLEDRAGEIDALHRVAELHHKQGDRAGEARAHVRIAACWIGDNELEKAEASYGDALQLVPDDPDALEGRAELAARAGQLADAIGAYRRLVDHAVLPQSRRQLAERALARLLIETGDLEGARPYLEHVDLELDPDTLVELAGLEQRAGRLDAAAHALGRAARGVQGERAAELQLQLGELLARLGRNEESIAALEGAYHHDPRSAMGERAARALASVARTEDNAPAEARWLDAMLLVLADPSDRYPAALRRAELFLSAGDPVGARSVVDELTRVGMGSVEVRRLSATIAGVLGNELGRATTLESLADEGGDPSTIVSLLCGAASARMHGGDSTGALATAQRAFALAPSNPIARRTLADAYWHVRDWDEVVARYGELLAEAEGAKRAELARRLGTGLERQGAIEQAIAAYRGAVDTPEAEGESLVGCWRQLVEVYERGGDHRRALECLLAMAADPRTQESQVTRADHHRQAAELLHRRLGRIDEALAQLEEALRIDPTNLRTLDALDVIYGERGDHAQVAATIARKIKAASSEPELQTALLARLGELQATLLGKRDSARQAFRLALKLDPDFRPALRFLAADALERRELTEAEGYYQRLADPRPGFPPSRIDGDNTAAERTAAEAALSEIAATRSRMSPAPATQPVQPPTIQSKGRRAPTTVPSSTLAAELAPLEARLGLLELDDLAKRCEVMYQIGEVYRAHGDAERASGMYLKAIDLDGTHVPTLRQLVDYFWQAQDSRSLLECAAELEVQGELFTRDTPALAHARVAIAAGLEGNLARAEVAAKALGPAGAVDFATALGEAARWTTGATTRLLALADRLCRSPGPARRDVHATLVALAVEQPHLAALASALERSAPR